MVSDDLLNLVNLELGVLWVRKAGMFLRLLCP